MNDYKSKLYVLSESDPYKILGVDENSSIEEINIVYKELAKAFHPDRNSHLNTSEKEELVHVFTKMTSAFNMLRDPEEMKKYNYEKEMRLERERLLNNPNSISVNLNTKPQSTTISNTQPGINMGNLFNESKTEIKNLKRLKAESLFESGVIKYKKQDIESAIADFQSAIEIDGKVAKYHSYLGLAMKSKGWNGYAAAEFKVALNFDPNDKIALANNNFLNQQSMNPPQVLKEKSNDGILNRVKNIFKKS